MKYILSSTLLTLIALVGCSNKTPENVEQKIDNPHPTESPINKEISSEADVSMNSTQNTANQASVEATEAKLQKNNQDIRFKDPKGAIIELKTTDNFETAELTDSVGKKYNLKREISGSGIKLSNEQGVSIHFKGMMNGNLEGFVTLSKDKDIEIKEAK